MRSKICLPLVSIIVTNYNYEKYIEECLNSILTQTYNKIECIIIDDKSTDSSIEVIKKFISSHLNSNISFKLIESSKNKGQLAGFIKGIKEAKGEFICFVDADDVLLKDFVNIHIQTHFKYHMAFTSCQHIEIGSKSEIHSVYSKNIVKNGAQNEFEFDFLPFEELEKTFSIPECFDNIYCKRLPLREYPFGSWYWGPTSTAMFRKNALELFDTDETDEWRICADAFLFNYAHLIGSSLLIYAPLTAYRRHLKNGSSKMQINGNRNLLPPDVNERISYNFKILHKSTYNLLKKQKDKFLGNIEQRGLSELVGDTLRILDINTLKNFKQDICELAEENVYNCSLNIKEKLLKSK